MGVEQYLQKVAAFSGDIRTGMIAFDYRTGQCGPGAATQLRSWGPACPPGYCPPDNLPAALNRYFAGERAGCKEIPYSLLFTATSNVATTQNVIRTETSRVTMCPTRLIAVVDEGTPGQWFINSITFGNQNQIVGGPVAANVFGALSFQLVPMVPDCLRAGMPFTIDVSLGPEAGAPVARSLWLTFIGPMVG